MTGNAPFYTWRPGFLQLKGGDGGGLAGRWAFDLEDQFP